MNPKRINARNKGRRNEVKTQQWLEARGWTVFRIFQPMYHKQGPIDMIAVSQDGCTTLFIQSRTNQWGSLKELRSLNVSQRTISQKEVWRWDDGATEPLSRMIP